MKKRIVFRTEELCSLLSSVASVVNAKNTVPMLSKILLYTFKKNDSMYLTMLASDGDMWMQRIAEIENESDEGVSICVEAKDFAQAMLTLPKTVVTINVEENNTIAECTYLNGCYKLPYFSAKEYPSPSKVEKGTKAVTVCVANILSAMDKVSYATANDTINVILNGIHFNFTPEGMFATATDKRKMAIYKDFSAKFEESTMFNLPAKPCDILSKALRGHETEQVSMFFDDKVAVFKLQDFTLTARLLEGNYPDCEKIIPKNYTKFVDLDKDGLADALKRVMLMSNSSELATVSFNNNSCTVSSEDLDNSKSASEDILCEYNEENFKIGLNGNYIIQTLQSIGTDKVKVKFDTPMRPALFTESVDSESYSLTTLLMPMKFL